MQGRNNNYDEVLLRYAKLDKESSSRLDDLLKDRLGSTNWFFQDTTTRITLMLVKAKESRGISRNYFGRPDVKATMKQVAQSDFIRIGQREHVAELHGFIRIPEVESVFADEFGAEAFVNKVRQMYPPKAAASKETKQSLKNRLLNQFFDRIERVGLTLSEFYLGQEDQRCRQVICEYMKQFKEMYESAVTLSA